MVSWLIGAMLTTAQPRLVSLDVEVGSAKRAIEALSRASGVEIRILEPVASETVFLHTENRPLEEVLAAFARNTCSELVHNDDDSYTIRRPQKLVAAEEEKVIAGQLKEIQAWRKAVLPCLNYPYTADSLNKIFRPDKEVKLESSSSGYGLFSNAPIFRALARCIRDLDLRRIAKLTPRQAITFSTHPNAVQLALPKSAVEAMEKLLPESDTWRSFESGQDSANSAEGEAVYQPSDTVSHYDGDPSRILITFSLSDEQFQFRFIVLGRTGKPLVDYRDYIDSGEESEETAPSRQKSLPLPAFTLETQCAFNLMNGNRRPANFNENEALRVVEPFLTKPNLRDPLWFANQEMLSDLAVKRRKSVVACLPDLLFCPDVPSFERLLGQDSYPSTDVQESKEWLEIHPHAWVDHWAMKSNRQTMASVVSSGRSSGKARIQSICALAAGSYGQMTTGEMRSFVQKAIRKVSSGTSVDYELPSNPAFVSLMASLTPGQIQRMRNGEIIPYRQLTAAQLDLVSTLVYGTWEGSYEGGTAPEDSTGLSTTLELPGGILTGAGLGGDIVEDDVCCVGMVPENGSGVVPHEAFNLFARPENYVQFGFLCGGAFVGQPSVAPFRFRYGRVPRTTLKCFVTPNHYIAAYFTGAYHETSNNWLKPNEIDPATLTDLKSRLHIMSSGK